MFDVHRSDKLPPGLAAIIARGSVGIGSRQIEPVAVEDVVRVDLDPPGGIAEAAKPVVGHQTGVPPGLRRNVVDLGVDAAEIPKDAPVGLGLKVRSTSIPLLLRSPGRRKCAG